MMTVEIHDKSETGNKITTFYTLTQPDTVCITILSRHETLHVLDNKTKTQTLDVASVSGIELDCEWAVVKRVSSHHGRVGPTAASIPPLFRLA